MTSSAFILLPMYNPQQIVPSILPRFAGASRPSPEGLNVNSPGSRGTSEPGDRAFPSSSTPEGLNLCARHVSRFDPFGVESLFHFSPPVSPGAIHVEALRASALGSTGYQPVPSGNLPDGTAMTLENKRALRVCERASHSVGQVAQRDGLVARSTQTGGETVATARPSASDASTGRKTRG